MKCPNCGSEKVNIQMVNSKMRNNERSVLEVCGRWLLIICTCGLWLLVPKKKGSSKIKSKKMAICQSCGESWQLK